VTLIISHDNLIKCFFLCQIQDAMWCDQKALYKAVIVLQFRYFIIVHDSSEKFMSQNHYKEGTQTHLAKFELKKEENETNWT
jgi:hypothetical protein